LNENHKSHEITSLEKACLNEMALYELSLENALIRENDVKSMLYRLRNHLNDLEESANKNR
jgi:hypothetical protein